MEISGIHELQVREMYSLDGAILAHGFLSNQQTLNDYRQEKNNLMKVIESGFINSPNARVNPTDFDRQRYGAGGDLPIDANRVCFYLWKNEDPQRNDRTYSREAVWIGPMHALKGLTAHADPGDPGESIGGTSSNGKVEIPLEAGKILITQSMFTEIFPEISKRAAKLGIILDEYLSANFYILERETLNDATKITDIAFQNISPARGVTAKVEVKDGITDRYMPESTVEPYTAEQLGESKKFDNDQWKQAFHNYCQEELKSSYFDSRSLVELSMIAGVAEQTNNIELKELAHKAMDHVKSMPYASI